MANTFVHSELNTIDAGKAKDFYGKLFEWKLEDVPMGGGTYTVMTETGLLVQIAGKDADAIGQEVVPSPTGSTGGTGEEPIEKLVWKQLKTCFDPEISVNIVDLGLVYHCGVTPLTEGGNKVEVRFTLTAPGCGMGDVLRRDIESKLRSVPGVIETNIQVVFDPPWNASLMSEAAKLQLGLM